MGGEWRGKIRATNELKTPIETTPKMRRKQVRALICERPKASSKFTSNTVGCVRAFVEFNLSLATLSENAVALEVWRERCNVRTLAREVFLLAKFLEVEYGCAALKCLVWLMPMQTFLKICIRHRRRTKGKHFNKRAHIVITLLEQTYEYTFNITS